MTPAQMADQIRKAVATFPLVSSMAELWKLPPDSFLLADNTVWAYKEYLLAQGMSSARNGELFTGTARVLWIPS